MIGPPLSASYAHQDCHCCPAHQLVQVLVNKCLHCCPVLPAAQALRGSHHCCQHHLLNLVVRLTLGPIAVVAARALLLMRGVVAQLASQQLAAY